MSLWIAAALLGGGALLGIGLGIEERRRSAPALPDGAPTGAGDPATPDDAGDQAATRELYAPTAVTVLLPVRNEAINVRACAEALLGLAGQPPVRIVDDSSNDGTAEIAAALAAAEPRLSVIAAGPLPDGWLGKVHAMRVGAQGVASPWLLLTDADVRQRPPALVRALAAAAQGRLDVVSLTGWQEARGLAENLLVPPVFALLDALLGDWRAVAANGGAPVATGQFLLLRRTAWEECGGFAAVRTEPLDDVAIAVEMRRRGYRTGFFRAPQLLSVRMYRGWRETTRGWRRNLGGLFGRRRGAALAALAILALPPLAIAALAVAGCAAGAALLWAAGAATSGLLRAGSGHRPAYALLYPLDAVLLAAVLAIGVRDSRRGYLVNWRGRGVRL